MVFSDRKSNENQRKSETSLTVGSHFDINNAGKILAEGRRETKEERSTRIELTVAAAELSQRISYMHDIKMELLGLKPKVKE